MADRGRRRRVRTDPRVVVLRPSRKPVPDGERAGSRYLEAEVAPDTPAASDAVPAEDAVEPDAPAASPSAGPAPGPTARHAPRRIRRRRLRRALMATVLLAVVSALGIGVTIALVGGFGVARGPAVDGDLAPPEGAAPASPRTAASAVAMITVDEAQAVSLALLAVDEASELASIVLVPLRLVSEVPGFGSLDLAEAFAFGGPDTVRVALDNVLLLDLDEVLVLDRDGWASLAGRAEGIPVEVRRELPGEESVIGFAPGPALLEGDRVVDYLVLRPEGSRELDALPRTQQVLEGLLDQIARAPERFGARASDGLDELEVAGDGLLVGDPARLQVLLLGLADARARDLVTTLTLPVAPLGAEPDDRYRLDDDRAPAVIEERFGPFSTRGGPGAGIVLQVLNGNGAPGVGQLVAERVTPGGYQVRLTGNAEHFDHPTTRIVLHDTDPAQVEVGRDLQARLGVGEIERSGTPQSVVDVTLIVGADFPPPAGG